MDEKERGKQRKTSIADAESLWSPQQLADYLGVSVRTVYKWRARGDVPDPIRIGKLVRFRLSDIEAWLASKKRPARSERA